MTSIIVVFPKPEDAKNIRNLLVRHGFDVAAVCTAGSQAIQYAEALNDGIVICGYRAADMMYTDLHDFLPPHFEMLLVASQHLWSECVNNDIVCVAMPVKVHDLVSTVEMMVHTIAGRRRKNRQKRKERSESEKEMIRQAKALLMERNNMTEEEAHRYLQKCSMDSGTNLVETAGMVMSIY
ncbi:ANTAR domain-containing protein [Diplocloster hominis]|uniref:ANTAR domain-containing response regulator n=1 Tax=Diplocloster hominis TaxID=3079010 RepID=UPI0031BAF991